MAQGQHERHSGQLKELSLAQSSQKLITCQFKYSSAHTPHRYRSTHFSQFGVWFSRAVW